jgi:hypothetical protein
MKGQEAEEKEGQAFCFKAFISLVACGRGKSWVVSDGQE